MSYTAFGILALRSAGQSAGAATVRWLTGSQNQDGGFGVARSTQSDTDMTGAALQALAVTGRSRGAVARRAVGYLRRQQNRDGGFGQMDGRESNSQSTSYAVQGLAAVHAAPAAVARALTYLRRRQGRDGSVAYSASSTQTPVWVTAQALMALRRAPLPIATVPRAPKPEPADAPAEGHRKAQGAAPRGSRRAPRAAPTKTKAPDAPAAGGGAIAELRAGRDLAGRRASPPASWWTARAATPTPTAGGAGVADGAGRHGGARRARAVPAPAAALGPPALD